MDEPETESLRFAITAKLSDLASGPFEIVFCPNPTKHIHGGSVCCGCEERLGHPSLVSLDTRLLETKKQIPKGGAKIGEWNY
jgi:hypothetical protein